MLQQLISHNADLAKLKKKGYQMEVKGGRFLLVHQIPFVNSQKKIEKGTLVCTLDLITPSRVGRPRSHTAYFIGETPCDFNGKPLDAIINNSRTLKLTVDITINHYFSSKPACGYYNDYYEKIHTYATILSSYAQAISEQL